MSEETATNGPITPAEVTARVTSLIPAEVFECFNDLILRGWSGSSAVVLQNEAVELITERLAVTRDEVFSKHYLDVESAYRSQGWVVEYDKPGFNETYQARYTFTAPAVPSQR